MPGKAPGRRVRFDRTTAIVDVLLELLRFLQIIFVYYFFFSLSNKNIEGKCVRFIIISARIIR